MASPCIVRLVADGKGVRDVVDGWISDFVKMAANVKRADGNGGEGNTGISGTGRQRRGRRRPG